MTKESEGGIREGATLSVRCPDCGGELEANKRFTFHSQSGDEPEEVTPFWSTTCRACGHRVNFTPESGEVQRFE